MAGKVFFSVTMSLDGFMAPEAVPVEDVFSPEGQNDPRVQRCAPRSPAPSSGATNPSSDIVTLKNTFPAISAQLPSERYR